MSHSILLSGPAHSGKSTLAGYIWSKNQNEKYLKRLDEKIRDDLGDKYDASRLFGYYVDTGFCERRKSSSKIGTSEFIHITNFDKFQIKNSLITRLIDSPGSNVNWNSRYLGTHLGDIGVIVIELGDFINLPSKAREQKGFLAARKRLLRPIYLWKEYKSIDHMIIAISKMDGNTYSNDEYTKNDYSSLAFAKALSIIFMDSDLTNIPIIPIAIDIKNKKDENIFEKSLKMPWYEGNVLIDEISKKLLEISDIPIAKIPVSFAAIEREFRSKETNEPILRVKVTNGELKKKDHVYLTQISISKKNSFCTGEGIIKSLKLEDGDFKDVFQKGDIGGIAFSKIMISGKQVDTSEICLSRASYIIDKNTNILTGNLLFLKSQKANAEFADLLIYDKINILMFGKIVSTVLVSKKIQNGYCYLCVYTNNYPITLPVLQNNSIPFSKYVIEKANTDFMAVILYALEEIGENKPYILEVNYNSKGIKFDEILGQLFEKFEINKNIESFLELKIYSHNIESAAKSLRLFLNSNHVNDYSVNITEYQTVAICDK